MAVAEFARLALYLFEWIWTVVVLGIFPSQLIVKNQPLAQAAGGRGDVCSLTQTVGISRCNFGIAWAAIAFAVLTVAIAWHCLDCCTMSGLPYNVETVIFGWLCLWWLFAGVVLAAVKAGNAPRAANVVVVFAFMLAAMSFASAFIAARTGTKQMRPSVSTDSDDVSVGDGAAVAGYV